MSYVKKYETEEIEKYEILKSVWNYAKKRDDVFAEDTFEEYFDIASENFLEYIKAAKEDDDFDPEAQDNKMMVLNVALVDVMTYCNFDVEKLHKIEQ